MIDCEKPNVVVPRTCFNEENHFTAVIAPVINTARRDLQMEVAAAEKEASEVLHTLLSIERIQDSKQTRPNIKEDVTYTTSRTTKTIAETIGQNDLICNSDNRVDVENTDSTQVELTNTEQEAELTCDEAEDNINNRLSKVKETPRKKQKGPKVKNEGDSSYDPTRLEDNALQVLERFKRGCECQDDQCFSNLNPESVYRHRLNIAELTKAEHDMYLMGVTMACLTNPYQTARNTERRRLRAQYVYQGRRVCLDAFLYLENCTHYQIKRIRKHLVTHGVTPRVHGNHGKVPHNTFSLDIYQIATEFLKSFIKEQEAKQKTNARHGPLHLGPDVTRKTVHDLYTDYCKKISPSIKIMGYSTFRRFMKVQFPQVKFAKLEFVVRGQNQIQIHSQTQAQSQTSTRNQSCASNREEKVDDISSKLSTDHADLMPLVIADGSADHNAAYYLTSVDKLQDGISYQLTTSGYLVNHSGVPLTVANVTSI